MPMPSLFKYFTVVGSALLGLLLGINYVLDPGGPARPDVSAPPKIVVQHDPRASWMERWRNEQAALKAAEQARTAPAAAEPVTIAAKGTQELAQAVAPVAASTAPAAEPVAPAVEAAVAATAPTESQPASLSPQAEPQPEPAARLAAVKAKKAAKAARKARLARERERALAARAAEDPFYAAARQRAASSQQDQYYYGQRSAFAQPQSAFGYAPRPTYGPFGGFGRGW